MTASEIIDKRLKESIKLFDIRYIKIKDHPDVEKDNLNEAILSAMKEYAKEKCAEQRVECEKNAEFGDHYDPDWNILSKSILEAPEPNFD